MRRRTLLFGMASLAAYASMPVMESARAKEVEPQLETADITIGVGGKSLLYYLPLTIAERKGYFKEQGLNVTINNLSGGATSLSALISGSVDIVTGAYEHTIRMQEKGRDVVGICSIGRFPGIVIAVRTDLGDEIRSVKDLAGRKIGVTAPGSSSAFMLQYALQQNGLNKDAASIIGVGGGASAVAAIMNREIDGLSHVDPVIAQLEDQKLLKILVDTRTEAGTRSVVGGPDPAGTVYTQQSFINSNPVATQRVVNAFMKALDFIAVAKPGDIADVVPQEYLAGNRRLYIEAYIHSREMYSRDGLVTQEGYETAMKILKALDPDLSAANVAFDKTFNASFVRASRG